MNLLKRQLSPDYADIGGLNGVEDNMGGLTKRAWFAPKRWFDALQEVSDDLNSAATMAELAEISTTHTFLTGKGFIEIYNTRDMGEVKGNSVGERDGKGSKIVGNVFVPGLNPTKLGAMRMMKNDELIWLFELLDGTMIQVGSKRLPAEQSLEVGSAKNESGTRGSKITADAYESFITIYSGTVTLYP